MALPSLDQLRRNVEKLRADVAEPPEERGYPFGYVPPELKEMYREWYERDPGAALAWRMQQPGFDIREVIRQCAAVDDETRAEIMRRNEERRRARGLYDDDDDEDREIEADEPAENADLDHPDEPEPEERENQAVNVAPDGPPEATDGPEPSSGAEDDPEPAPEPPEPPQPRNQTGPAKASKPATPGSPWSPWPSRSLSDELKGW